MRWQVIIEELLEAGLEMSTLAEQARVSKEAIRKLKVGVTREPRFGVGKKLITAHMKVRPDLYPKQSDQFAGVQGGLLSLEERSKLVEQFLAYAI